MTNYPATCPTHQAKYHQWQTPSHQQAHGWRAQDIPPKLLKYPAPLKVKVLLPYRQYTYDFGSPNKIYG